ncbi:MAG TPA: hypothetical protein P5531_05610 [Bacteroidales bacterium]|nr:hypothetical protein [Bacteroidales bacterium]HSA42884.1 hypothetical protein [Bacteroidales bacterium]
MELLLEQHAGITLLNLQGHAMACPLCLEKSFFHTGCRFTFNPSRVAVFLRAFQTPDVRGYSD